MRVYKPKPTEMLFDLQSDPWEMNNLAADPAQAATKARLNAALSKHLRDTGDIGFFPQSERRAHDDLLAYAQQRPAMVEEILDAVELAGQAQANDIPRLSRLLQSPEPTVRYWAANGLADLAFAGQLLHPTPELRAAREDAHPDVRAVAFEAAAYAGDEKAARQLIGSGVQSPLKHMLLETMALHRPQFFGDGPDLSKVDSFSVRALRINLGLLPARELYTPVERRKALRSNSVTRGLGPYPNSAGGSETEKDE